MFPLDAIKMIVEISTPVVSVIIGLIALIFTLRMLRKSPKGQPSFKITPQQLQQSKYFLEAAISSVSSTGGAPVETEHLARYHAQVLLQTKVAFWFSIFFGAAGFLVIVAAAFLYTEGKLGVTIVQGIAGVIVDAVASLFFIQSNRAQKSMTEFFDKLRKDRQQVESRKLCEEVHNPDAKDALRIQLSLFYAGLENHDTVAHDIVSVCFGDNRPRQKEKAQS